MNLCLTPWGEWPIFHRNICIVCTHHDHGAPAGGGDHLHHVHRGGQDPITEPGEDPAAVHQVDVVRKGHHQPGQADRDASQQTCLLQPSVQKIQFNIYSRLQSWQSSFHQNYRQNFLNIAFGPNIIWIKNVCKQDVQILKFQYKDG